MRDDVSDALLQQLDDEHAAVLRHCGQAAAARAARAYLVGGSVRDLMLRRPHDDLDVVVEGDGLGVAQDMGRWLHGELTRHHAFQTATVQAPGGLRLDVATARREDYPRPGQLPRVVAGTLAEDLERRDFTINAMAISLQTDHHGRFIDPQGGREDLRRGLVRVMHERSFADDPTRILRALRFALRFDYALEDSTRQQLAAAVAGGYLDEVSGDRVRRELRRTFSEAPVRGPTRLHQEGVLEGLQPGLRAEEARLRRLQALLERAAPPPAASGAPRDGAAGGEEHSGADLDGADAQPWTLVLACCAVDLPQQSRWQLARRLRLSREERAALIDAGNPWRKAVAQLGGPSDEPPAASRIERALRGLSPGALLVAATAGALDEPPATLVARYLEKLRDVRPALDGDALQEMGVARGPQVGEFLEKLRAARLDGALRDLDDERRAVAAWLAANPRR